MKKTVSIPGAPKPIGPYSPAVLMNNMLFVSGQIPLDPNTGEFVPGGVEPQAIQVMKNIEGLLNEAGMGFADVVKSTIFLADMNDFAVVNQVYSTFFTGDYPARETVQVARLPKDALVEISVIATK
jgi:2-iminobutanoate/2-iminopropanoate deaminase